MGETTYGGRDTLRNKDGLLMIEELARLALQRCATAREAILYMGELAYEYGYGDGGERTDAHLRESEDDVVLAYCDKQHDYAYGRLPGGGHQGVARRRRGPVQTVVRRHRCG